MQFGSLNMANGENRLNVAVTRARKKIKVVSSLLPTELKVDNTANEGPKVFRDYLEYAFNVSNGNYTPTPFKSESIKSEYFLKNTLSEISEDYSCLLYTSPSPRDA